MAETEKVFNVEEELKKLKSRVDELEEGMPKDKLTMGLISGNLDSTMAAFIEGIGAAAYDMEVDFFFSFWSVAALRDPKKRPKKNLLDKMFGWMLPSSSKKLPLSKMQMMGAGPMMINKVMKMHNAKSLPELMKDAADLGIKIHVCTMSMDVMGIKREELIDYPGLDFVGVGTFVDLFSESKQCWFM